MCLCAQWCGPQVLCETGVCRTFFRQGESSTLPHLLVCICCLCCSSGFIYILLPPFRVSVCAHVHLHVSNCSVISEVTLVASCVRNSNYYSYKLIHCHSGMHSHSAFITSPQDRTVASQRTLMALLGVGGHLCMSLYWYL